MKRLAAFLFVALIFSSCTPPQPDMGQIRKAIDDMNARSTKDMVAGVWDSTMANYTDDAYSLPNFAPMAKGKQAIKEMYTKLMAGGMKFTKVEFKTVDVQASGDQVVEIGTYAMTMEIPQVGPMNDAGKYVTVYHHAPDGSLKIKVETWNSDSQPMDHMSSN
jgi:ketosteroid isomerase-like protein